ncbi:MAG TPA: NADH-quinone oxidoreductase subunit NuoH [Anaerolineaceae bacterium]|nr:NADH-quinone oxidoreductase subunit NuoH [Anaerolineaceae bacterium]
MDFGMILEWIIKSIVLVLLLTGGFAYTTLFERKVLARMQVRIGPNRAGPLGSLQPIADAVKLIFKEELTPTNADKFLFFMAPIITVMPALVVLGVVPWGGTVNLFGRQVHLYIADVNVAVLYILSVTSISVYGITLAGWASNNKYAMLGGMRATAQMISYELSLGLAYLGPIMIAGSLSLVDIVNAQKGGWFILNQPVAFLIYIFASLAEINRAPFDMPEAEQELTAGYHTEYSGMKFALFFMAEYIKMIAIAIIGVTLFLGGYQGPGVEQYPGLGPIYLLLKTGAWIFVIVWIRATLPRIRYDRLMALEWKIMLPIALLNVVVTGVVIVLTGG